MKLNFAIGTAIAISIFVASSAVATDPPKPSAPISFTKEQITARIATLEKKREEVTGQLFAIEGAIADYKYLIAAAEESAKTSTAPATTTAEAGEKK